MAISAVAWRLRDGNTSTFLYRLQTKGCNFKSKNKVLKAMDGWKVVGSVLQANESIEDFIFSKTFQDAHSWVAWAQGFPYVLAELSSTSDAVKPVKLGLQTRARKGTAKKKGKVRVCRKCGTPGHNARTCGKKNTPAPVTVGTKLAKRTVTCKKCGGKGHQARTCGKKVVETKQKKFLRCSYCCEFGHNVRTCPEKKGK